jgi:hypothetical protein
MNAITQLEEKGYTFTVEGDKIRYALHHKGEPPDPAIVGPLLAELKERKAEAILFLRQGASVMAKLSKPTDALEFLDCLHANHLAIVPGSLRWIARPDDPFTLIPAVAVQPKGGDDS